MIPQVVAQLRFARDKLFDLVEVLSTREGLTEHILSARSQVEAANGILKDEPALSRKSNASEDESDGTEY